MWCMYMAESDSAVCITLLSQAPRCALLRGVKLCSVHHPAESSSTVCITPQSQALQCASHCRVKMHTAESRHEVDCMYSLCLETERDLLLLDLQPPRPTHTRSLHFLPILPICPHQTPQYSGIRDIWTVPPPARPVWNNFVFTSVLHIFSNILTTILSFKLLATERRLTEQFTLRHKKGKSSEKHSKIMSFVDQMAHFESD